jgi:3-hydroxyacyl-[acyl-carrier-protein] dehydratase
MNKPYFSIKDILNIQANKYPVLFIDRVESCVPGEKTCCIKNFTYNEWFFPSHYDDDPNVPGFILIESMVQSFLISFLSLEEFRGSRTSFLDVKNAIFRKKVIPGDTLIIESKVNSFKRGVAKGISEATVNGEFACSADFVVGIPNVMEKFRPDNEIS